MKKVFICLSLFSFLFACKSKDKEGSKPTNVTAKAAIDSTLVTDSAWGLITSVTSFDDLKTIYGAATIKDERICGPECIDSLDVTLLYPGTKNESIIYWKDSAYHKQIGSIECYSDSADWHTAAGIKIGSGFKELLKLNGKPIKFYGFGWDYGGGIISYNNGALEKSPIHFDIDLNSQGNDTSLLGDIELDSDMPAVQKASDNIVVRKISLSFYKDL
jgi:hypothetical protein